MSSDIAIHWFRQDLRLSDNPALSAATEHESVLPLYILDDEHAGEHSMGGASRWWLHHSLNALNKSLEHSLSIYKSDPLSVLLSIIEENNKRNYTTTVYWNRCYEPWRIARDKAIKAQLESLGITVKSFNGSLLWEPWEINKADGTPYKVFTPYFRKGCLNASPPREPIAAPKIKVFAKKPANACSLDQLDLLPKIPWDKQLEPHWNIGEQGAQQRLAEFIEEGLAHYKGGRDIPSKPYTSRIAPHIHFGEVSPNQLWYTIRGIADNEHTDHYGSELAWREFSYSQLYHFPDLPTKNLHTRFDRFPWAEADSKLEAWQHGNTGIPMVDAGMRELWQTGYMHNRVRMVVGSFLVKNLRFHWYHGERWFWDTLLDADLANNSAGWQWIAGCGADAAPYFRVFNPVLQGQKFDKDGEYIRQYIPEISGLPKKYLYSPWEAPEEILREANIELGVTYPKPIVDLKASRVAALDAFKSLKANE